MKSFRKLEFLLENGSHSEMEILGCDTNGCAPHQSPPRSPLPVQVIQGIAEFDQIQIQDWDKEAEEDEAAAEEEELIWVQQEIQRLRQEQESIMGR
jgi:hypothetical protein